MVLDDGGVSKGRIAGFGFEFRGTYPRMNGWIYNIMKVTIPIISVAKAVISETTHFNTISICCFLLSLPKSVVSSP